MSGHLIDKELIAWAGRALDPQSLLRADRHLSSCAACHRKLRESTHPVEPEIIRDITSPFHLTYDSLSAFISGSISKEAREAAELHLSFCTECQQEMAALLQFDATISSSAPITKQERLGVSKFDWLHKFWNGLFAPGLHLAPVAAMLVGALLLVAPLLRTVSSTTGSDSARASVNELVLIHTERAFSSHPTQMYIGLTLFLAGIICWVLLLMVRRVRRKQDPQNHSTTKE